jgi:hypothetical protein
VGAQSALLYAVSPLLVQKKQGTQMKAAITGVSSALVIHFVFRQDGLFPEIADQVKGCPERYDILEKEQAQ